MSSDFGENMNRAFCHILFLCKEINYLTSGITGDGKCSTEGAKVRYGYLLTDADDRKRNRYVSEPRNVEKNVG